jgi:hypothetical protein
MGSVEFPKQINVSVFSFKTKSVGVIRKKIGAMFFAGGVLVSLNALSDYDAETRGNQPDLFV